MLSVYTIRCSHVHRSSYTDWVVGNVRSIIVLFFNILLLPSYLPILLHCFLYCCIVSYVVALFPILLHCFLCCCIVSYIVALFPILLHCFLYCCFVSYSVALFPIVLHCFLLYCRVRDPDEVIFQPKYDKCEGCLGMHFLNIFST